VPDEQSNLNLPPAARRPNNRRRGRRGGRGRGRGPRPTNEPGQPPIAGDVAHPDEPVAETGAPPEGQTEFPQSPEVPPAAPAPESIPSASAAEEAVSPARPQPIQPHRHERRQDPPPLKPWVKPADFRPADTSAIHQAVAHATEIAEVLRELVDRIDEILELVEVAERQKLADERELDNLRRALRRIQPPRQSHSSEPHRGHSRGDSRSRQDFPRTRPESGPAHEPSHDQPQHAEETHDPEASHHDDSAEEHHEGRTEEHSDEHSDGQSGESHPES